MSKLFCLELDCLNLFGECQREGEEDVEARITLELELAMFGNLLPGVETLSSKPQIIESLSNFQALIL